MTIPPSSTPTHPALLHRLLASMKNQPDVYKAPEYWTSEQRLADPGSGGMVLVGLAHGTDIWNSLSRLLNGHGVGDGGRDHQGRQDYSRLQLEGAYRIENRLLWGKYAHERLAVEQTVDNIRKRGGVIEDPRVENRLSRKTRLNRDINEVYLLHGLGHPEVLLNIAEYGCNEHFAGSNAGTMFGAGIYFAEDAAKSDQYCKPLSSVSVTHPGVSALVPRGLASGNARVVVVCRVVLGAPLCLGYGGGKGKVLNRNFNGDRNQIFAPGASDRELVFVPEVPTASFHSIVSEINGKNNFWKGMPTHSMGFHLRYREFVSFHPTLIYPEYVLVYSRQR